MHDKLKDMGKRLDAMLADPAIDETVRIFRAQELLKEFGAPFDRMRIQRIGAQWRFIVRKENKRSQDALTRVNSPDDLPF